MKPRLETQRDIDIKNKVKIDLISEYNVEILDLYEPLYIVDWFMNNETFVEFKARNYLHYQFPTLMLSLHKWMTLRNYAANGFRAGLCVQWKDFLGYLTVTKEVTDACTYSHGGRKDRGIEGDVEPCVYIPIDKFAALGDYIK